MSARRRLVGAACTLLGLVLTLPACSRRVALPATSTAPPARAAAVGKPAFGGSVTLALEADPDSLNPLYSATAEGFYLTDLLFDGLTYINEKLEVAPRLARSWESSPDGTEWTFHLREDATFHDGQPVTAEDVVYTYRVLMDRGYTGPRAESVAPVRDVTAVDPHTVRFTLKEAYAPFLRTGTQIGILPRHLLAGVPVKELEKAPWGQEPVGSGPYRFVEWQPGQYIELEANEDWFLKKDGLGPWIKTIRWQVIPDPDARVAALESGRVDAVYNVPGAQVARLKEEKKGTLRAYDWQRMGFGYIALNTSRPPLDDRRVRQALSYALDREAIVREVLHGMGVVPPGPIPPASWAYKPDAKGYAHDPQKAAELLVQAGYNRDAEGRLVKGGKPLVLKFYGSNAGPVIEGVAQQVRKDWGALGIQVDVELLDFATMMQTYVMPGNYDAAFSAFSLDADPDSLYALYHSSSGRPDAQGRVRGFNRSRYANPEVDRLLEEARRTADQEKRKALYARVQELVVEDAPHIWVYTNTRTDFTSARVKGVVNTPGYGIALFPWRWYVEEE
ncbi:peptide-binding protein [Caldinitratiruptor microaerophilus]|uniref:Peptide-binding protein n=1 Tax=Caldinitratiruptor microaerophilus TaxID=671077 RepID=A0AA35G8Y3_9FIRM|nr:peptide-binding protein [Caldinitratiruptor microaerophilus]BDG60903.1 peptide-binding protein [Caldinitratiruptor microaerophilus]